MAASAIHDPVGWRIWTEKVLRSEFASSQSPLMERLKMAFERRSVQSPAGTVRIPTEASMGLHRRLSSIL
jgi:hypothetical protein